MSDAARARDSGSFLSLARWTWPFLRPSRGALWIAGLTALVMLASQAVTPLVVERILSAGSWNASLFAILALLIIVQIFLGYVLERQAHSIAGHTGDRLANAIFRALLGNRLLHQQGMVRPSIVSRHTHDADVITEALQSTIVSGIPGVIRLIQSLVLLTFIEWRAGLAMTCACLVFLFVRAGVGRGLVTADRARLDARSRVSEIVDDAISAASPTRGMRLGAWLQTRMASASQHLRTRTIAQGTYLAQLSTAARAAGLAGLLFVVIFAVALGGTTLAAAAAALLYIEAVVRSLEALPPWIRQLQLALVSRTRIDQILQAPGDASRPTSLAPMPELPGVMERATARRIVGLVPGPNVDADDALSVMAVEVDGVHVPHEVATFNLPLLEHLRALRPDLTEQEALRLLEVVDLTSPALPWHEPIGPGGSLLTLAERQRLTLAMALAGRPTTVLIGPILPLRDADRAPDLIHRIAAGGVSTLIVVLDTPELAEAMDEVVFIAEDEIRVGHHAELLVSCPAYAAVWERRLQAEDVDLSSIGIEGDLMESLHARLVMERYASGDMIYRKGDPADRVVFVVAGRLEILADDEGGDLRRVGVLGPGNHCGDLRLTVGEKRAETVRCLDDSVVRTLSRAAISSGMVGLLDRTDAERRLLTVLLRQGAGTEAELRLAASELTEEEFAAALALLIRDGAVHKRGDVLSPATRRSTKAGAEDVLDRLTGLL